MEKDIRKKYPYANKVNSEEFIKVFYKLMKQENFSINKDERNNTDE